MKRTKRPVSLKVNNFVIWEYLTKENLAQNELAKRPGISSGYMAQLIGGSRSPSPKLRRKMLDVLSPLSFQEIFVITRRGDGGSERRDHLKAARQEQRQSDNTA